jgi:hypothetical protein
MSDSYIARSQAIAARALGGNMVIMSGASSLFTLNEVATAIWEAADGSKRLSQIVEQVVCRDFEVDPQVARSDAEELVEKLVGHGLLVTSDQPIACGGDA